MADQFEPLNDTSRSPDSTHRELSDELSRINGKANEMLLRFIGHGLVEADRYAELEATLDKEAEPTSHNCDGVEERKKPHPDG